MKILTTLVLLLSSTAVFAQIDTTMIKNWKSYPIPTNKDTLLKYNWSHNWEVSIQNGDVKVTKETYPKKLPFSIQTRDATSEKFRGTPYTFKVDDGYLVSFFKGEFGGNVFWFSADGKDDYEIPGGYQVVQFIKRDGKIYGIEGLAHLSLSSGSIIEFLKINGKWTAKDYLRLPKAPHAVKLDSKGNFIIVTSPALLSVDRNANIKTLISEGIWYPYLYPSSLAIDKNIVYIGMRKGVYQYNLNTAQSAWLMPH